MALRDQRAKRPARKAPPPETEIAKPAMALLQEMGFELYQEVPLYDGGQRADIVGVLAGKTVAIVEVKAGLSFDVIAQAKRWDAHWRWVAVPSQKGGASDGRRLAMEICGSFGIGVIEVIHAGSSCPVVEIKRYPALRRTADVSRLLAQLRPEHKTFAAAGTSGRYWSRWRDSVARLVAMVRERPGIPMSMLLAEVPTHWASTASAKSCVSQQIADGSIKELRLEQADGRMRVYPTEGAACATES